uniref:Uncharacterized protein n=1 Tax=Oryza rufipogon TaxID=4529 RepID=A0A679BDI6_ORYRU|nr:hypothetical protein [Oryza rufipogon]
MAMAVVRAAAVDGDGDGCLWRRFASSPSSSFVAYCCVAHAALVERGAALADRLEVARSLLGEYGYTITRCRCGPVWQILRRNLVAETLHLSRVRLARPREDTTDQHQLVFPGNNYRAKQDTSRCKISSVIIFF